MATKPRSEGGRGSFGAWGKWPDPALFWQEPGDYGSYGINLWVCDIPYGLRNRSEQWRKTTLSGANRFPVLLDSWWIGGEPAHTNSPPPYEGSPVNQMSNFACVNRHNGKINGLFGDFSAKSMSIKALWTLKWHRKFDTGNLWTPRGDVQPEDWPKWMQNFKDY